MQKEYCNYVFATSGTHSSFLFLCLSYTQIVMGPPLGKFISDRRASGIEMVEGNTVLGSNVVAVVSPTAPCWTKKKKMVHPFAIPV